MLKVAAHGLGRRHSREGTGSGRRNCHLVREVNIDDAAGILRLDYGLGLKYNTGENIAIAHPGVGRLGAEDYLAGDDIGY